MKIALITSFPPSRHALNEYGFHVAEQFTGRPGKYVKLEDTIRSFKEVADGKHDNLPEGAFYAFPNVSAITQDDRALAKFLLEEGGVACGGGSSFGAAGKGYLRFSYAASVEDIDWALESIAKTLPNFKE